jgi:hypothetical protein
MSRFDATGQRNAPFIAPGSQGQGHCRSAGKIADANPALAPHRPRPVLETEEWHFESATEFIEALEKYYTERATQIKRKNH